MKNKRRAKEGGLYTYPWPGTWVGWDGQVTLPFTGAWRWEPAVVDGCLLFGLVMVMVMGVILINLHAQIPHLYFTCVSCSEVWYQEHVIDLMFILVARKLD